MSLTVVPPSNVFELEAVVVAVKPPVGHMVDKLNTELVVGGLGVEEFDALVDEL